MTPTSAANPRDIVNYLTTTAALPLIHTALGCAPARVDRGGHLRDLADSTVLTWRVEGVHHRPSGAVSVRFAVTLRCGEERLGVTTVASTEHLRPTPTTRTVRATAIDPNLLIHVWAMPHDPHLPGLAWATDPTAVSTVVDAPVLALTPVVYRPTRRAMIRADSDEAGGVPGAWIKVLPPAQAQALGRTVCVAANSNFPVASLIESPVPGVVIQRHVEGRTLAHVISRNPVAAARMGHHLVHTLDALPHEATTWTRHPSWTDQRYHYATMVCDRFPDREPEIRHMMTIIDRLLRDDLPIVATHGDFFEGNIIVNDREDSPPRVSAVLDLDHVGPGVRADDYACLLAHASVLPFLTPRQWVSVDPAEPWRSRLDQFLRGRRCPAYRESETVVEAWRLTCEQLTDPADLYARAACVTLSLAAATSLTDGDDEARARLARALWWVDLALDYRS